MSFWKGITKLFGRNGNIVDINEDGQMHVVLEGKVSSENSTVIPLLADGVFIGDSIITLSYSVIVVSVFSDVASATDGLIVEHSIDNVNWDHLSVFTIPANEGKDFSFQPQAQYMRVRYINGGLDQTVFRLQTILKKTYIKPSNHRIQDNIISEDDAELVKAVITGVGVDGIFRNAKVTFDGYLTITDSSSGLAIAEGDVAGKEYIHKFGNAPDFDTADNEVTIWDGADDGTLWELMDYIYSSTDDIDSISSNNIGDTQDIEIIGLDINYNLVTQVVTLNGQNRVALNTNLLRVYSMKNVNSVNLLGNVFCFVNTPDVAPADGVPDDPTKIRAIIHKENNQTEMAIYTVPAGKTGYMRSWFASTAGSSKDSSYVLRLLAREYGGIFTLKQKISISDTGSSFINHKYDEPEKFLEKTDIEIKVTMTAVGGIGASISAGFDMVLVDN